MANCGQACPYNTLAGCKVKEHNAICPLTNTATPIAEYRSTNADRIRAMSDEELCEFLSQYSFFEICDEGCNACAYKGDCDKRLLEWLKQPAEEK